jgi:hypothetical protein
MQVYGLVRLRKVSGPKRSWGTFTFQGLTSQSVNLHFARNAMFCLLYYTKSKSFHPFCCCHFYYDLLSKIIYLFSVWNISNPCRIYCYYFQAKKESCSSFVIHFLLINLHIQKKNFKIFTNCKNKIYNQLKDKSWLLINI